MASQAAQPLKQQEGEAKIVAGPIFHTDIKKYENTPPVGDQSQIKKKKRMLISLLAGKAGRLGKIQTAVLQNCLRRPGQGGGI